MIVHFLPGDTLVEQFAQSRIEGEVAVCRECLVEGDVSGDSLPEFWENRRRFLQEAYDDDGNSYHEKVVREFATLSAVQSGSEIDLWFEHDLFCQVNYWFTLFVLQDSPADIFRVAPIIDRDEDRWSGFGMFDSAGLRKCHSEKVLLDAADMQLGVDLWNAFRTSNHVRLKPLSEKRSNGFPFLSEACNAAIEKDSLPKSIVREIVSSGTSDPPEVFREFQRRAGIFGYGDSQVERIRKGL